MKQLVTIAYMFMALALAGCATPAPPRIETVTVKVPVAAPCLRSEQIPRRPVKPALPKDAVAALAVAVGHLLAWDAYGVEADGVMRGCAGVK